MTFRELQQRVRDRLAYERQQRLVKRDKRDMQGWQEREKEGSDDNAGDRPRRDGV